MTDRPPATPATDEEIAAAQALVDTILDGHPQYPGDREQYLAWQREMISIWHLNLESCLSGYVPRLIARINAMKDELQDAYESGRKMGYDQAAEDYY